ncbi:Primosomal protein I [Sinorhizobium alkalisoli]|nr:Primosomal protein I [Sinorhizobium alkalisoli]
MIDLPTVNGDVVSITEADVAEWAEAFPAVDVRQQLAAMRAWLNANPKNRKTSKGMKRFVVAWLTRDQDRGGGRQRPQAQSPPRPMSPSLQRHHDIHSRLKRDLYGEPDEQFAGPTVDLAAGDFRSH